MAASDSEFWTWEHFSADGNYIAIGGLNPGKQIEDTMWSHSSSGRIELWNVVSGKRAIIIDDIETYIHPTIFPVAFSQTSWFHQS